MPQPVKIWKQKARQRLKEMLGGRCVDCGRTEPEVQLEFAHVIPLSDEQAEYRVRIGSNRRLQIYRKEAKEGLLVLRCRPCNLKQAREPKQGFFTFDVSTLSRVTNVPEERLPF